MIASCPTADLGFTSGPCARPTTTCYAARLGQAACDGRFRTDMHAHCATRAWYQRAPCRFTAELYWEAVRRFGHLFY